MSVHPTPSAEGVGWTDFTLRMTELIHGWLNDPGTMEWCMNESGMRFLLEARSQSTQPPLQRGLGGLTSRLEWQEWFMDDGMILEWWNDAWMSLGWDSDRKLEVNDGMMLEWGEWQVNDGMRTGWLWLKLRSQKETVKIGASYWSRAQNRGLWLVERTPKKNLRGWPWFENEPLALWTMPNVQCVVWVT